MSPSGRLAILAAPRRSRASTDGDRIASVVAMGLDDAAPRSLQARTVIDATELGDLLPLCGAEHVVGAETVAQTGEPQAQPLHAKPHCVQSFTYTFACERRDDGERHVITRPEHYEHFRAAQPYSLRIEVHGGEIYGEASGWLDYRLYETGPEPRAGSGPIAACSTASVRRQRRPRPHPLQLARQRLPRSQHPRGRRARRGAALQDAKRVSLGFLHWLQTEAPAAGDRLGAPELRLRADVMGTADGLSKHPYIRESRRIRALKTIVEQEVSAHYQAGPRAAHFADSVGVGWYPIDIHRSGAGRHRRQLPHEAVPDPARRAAAGARDEPDCRRQEHRHDPHHQRLLSAPSGRVEHRRGGRCAGGVRARERVAPAAVRETPDLLARFQRRLLERGVPLVWPDDPDAGPRPEADDPAFGRNQLRSLQRALEETT